MEPLSPDRHGEGLFRANSVDDGRMWTYLPYGPFASVGEYLDHLESQAADASLFPYAIVRPDLGAVGLAAYLRAAPEHGSIEVGHIALSPGLQRTVAATEAMALMMTHVFDELGYRRYEWKCDSLNAPSGRAAERLGFRYEGQFRQAAVVRGRNRDTNWYAITDGDWPRLRHAFGTWLAPANFDADGRQRRSLRDLTRPDRPPAPT